MSQVSHCCAFVKLSCQHRRDVGGCNRRAGAREEVERIVKRVRARWPAVRIIVRADSGFCREELMGWCEQNAVDYVFELARNGRLVRALGTELQEAKLESAWSLRPARRFKEMSYRTRRSWSRARRVVVAPESS